MNFAEAYCKLEAEFRALVQHDWIFHDIESFYLPNIPPVAPVEFVLVGMEPSLGGRAYGTAMEQAEAGEFTNWGAYSEESTLPGCELSEFLLHRPGPRRHAAWVDGCRKPRPGHAQPANWAFGTIWIQPHANGTRSNQRTRT